MNFLMDHDIPAEVGRVLAQAGHTVVYVRHAMAPNAADQEVFEHAVQSGLVLVTCNRDDFLRLTRGRQHPGLIILIRRRTRIAECARVIRLLNVAGGSGVTGNVNFA